MASVFTAVKLVEVSDAIAVEFVLEDDFAKYAILSMMTWVLLGVLSVKSMLHCGVQLATMFKI